MWKYFIRIIINHIGRKFIAQYHSMNRNTPSNDSGNNNSQGVRINGQRVTLEELEHEYNSAAGPWANPVTAEIAQEWNANLTLEELKRMWYSEEEIRLLSGG